MEFFFLFPFYKHMQVQSGAEDADAGFVTHSRQSCTKFADFNALRSVITDAGHAHHGHAILCASSMVSSISEIQNNARAIFEKRQQPTQKKITESIAKPQEMAAENGRGF